jgi:hypothetical protein
MTTIFGTPLGAVLTTDDGGPVLNPFSISYKIFCE